MAVRVAKRSEPEPIRQTSGLGDPPEANLRNGFTIFAGTANPALAASIASELGVQLGACNIERFPDGEVAVRVLEPVRRKEVFLVQPTSPPVNDHLVELLALADACRRAAAARITAVIPYFGYARADKRQGCREPITARVIADLLEAVRVDHVVTVDLHAPQIEGFFHLPVDSLTAMPTICRALGDRLPSDAVVVSPDVGRTRLATQYAQCLGARLVVLYKQRKSGTETKVTHVIGDVSNRSCLIVDDIISTGGTLAESVTALLEAGARPEIIISATHGLLLQGARDNLDHPAIREVLVTDTVPVREQNWPKLNVISIAPLIAGALQRFLADGTLADLYKVNAPKRGADKEKKKHASTTLS